jgi:hypothetical protein
LATAVALFSLFKHGTYTRSYFVQTPYGASLIAFRSEVAALTPAGSTICATLDLDAPDQTLLIAEMSGAGGFSVPPIEAAQTYLVPPNQACPARGPASDITIKLNQRGNFVAAG